jgi:predicted RNA-binding Zn-ribbon protein involved in translation (DUF1610 family)
MPMTNKKKTPGVKLSQRTLDRLKKIAEYEETIQSAVLTRLINSRYEEIKAEIHMKENPCPKCGDWDYYTSEGQNVCLTCGHNWAPDK